MPGIVNIRGHRPAIVFNKDEKADKKYWDKLKHGFMLVWPTSNGQWWRVWREND